MTINGTSATNAVTIRNTSNSILSAVIANAAGKSLTINNNATLKQSTAIVAGKLILQVVDM